MANIELPKDAEGREIPRNTEVLYDINGKKVHITSFTYSFNVVGLYGQWKVFSFDISGEKDGMLPADSLYLTPPDSWEKLLEDLDAAGNARHEETCAYFNRDKDAYCCTSCPACNDDCVLIAMRDIASRIRKLRGED